MEDYPGPTHRDQFQFHLYLRQSCSSAVELLLKRAGCPRTPGSRVDVDGGRLHALRMCFYPKPLKWARGVFPLLAMAAVVPLAHAEVTRQSLRNAGDYSASRRGSSLLVTQGGRILLEEYPNGGNPRATHPIYSGTKTFFTLAALVAEQEGLLRLDEAASDTLGEWRGTSRARITLRELMNFSDGLDPAFRLHSNSVADRNALALRTPMVAPRGAAFTYGPSHGQVLCEVLRRKLAPRGLSPYDYVRRKVLDPLGIGDVEYRSDAQGMPLVASGFRLTARQWSKFGLMLLERGTYGRRTIVGQQAFAQCFESTRVNPMFGLGFWLNRGAGKGGARETDIESLLEKKWQDQDWHRRCICRSAPADLYAAVGSGYQRLFVIPSLGLVIVRQGDNAKFSDAEFLRRVLGR